MNSSLPVMLPFQKKIRRVMFTAILVLSISFLVVILIQRLYRSYDEAVSRGESELQYFRTELFNQIDIVNKYNEMISRDFDFLDFITSPEEKKGKDYYEFRKNILARLENILEINNFNTELKIFVDNPKLLAVPPLLYPASSSLSDRLEIQRSGDVFFLHDITTFMYRNRKIIVEFTIPLTNLLDVRDKSLSLVVPSMDPDLYISYMNRERTADKVIAALPDLDLILVYKLNLNSLLREITLYGLILLTITASYFLFLFYLSNRRIQPLFRDISILFEAVGQVKSGILKESVTTLPETSEFYPYSQQLQQAADSIHSLISDAVLKERSLQDMEQKALQAQINAHFLANTIEAIKMKALLQRNYEISDGLTDLGHMIRYAIQWDRQFVTLEEELEYIERFVNLYAMRFEYKLDYSVSMDRDLEKISIPKLTIEPFVENAIEHGIRPKGSDGQVSIGITGDDDYLYCTVADDGIGFDPESLVSRGLPGKGIGIRNVYDRLKKHYGTDFGLDIKTEPGKGTEIILRLRREKDAENSDS